MKPKLTINIAKDFSVEPIGRYVSDSPFSGQVFREKVLAPALEEAQVVEVVLDGTEGYGSSFLEESFGGLIRNHGFTGPELLERLHFVSREDPSLTEEILEYINDAEAARAH